MPGFNSQDQLIQAITNGQYWRTDWSKNNTNMSVGVVAGVYDTSMWPGYPPQRVHGNILKNSHYDSGTIFWSGIGAGGWAWSAANANITHTAGTSGNVWQVPAVPIVSGIHYTVIATTSTATAGALAISVGGGAPTANITTATTTVATVVGGGTQEITLIAPSATTMTIDDLYVIPGSGLTPRFLPYCCDRTQGAMWTGGLQTSKSKHLINLSAQTGAATGALSNLILVDQLGVYPFIDINKSTASNCDNSLTLPRYTDGKGVRAYVVASHATLANPVHNIAITYTNSSGVSGRTMGALVAGTISCGLSRISHTGAAANNYGPFLPLAQGDEGISSVESFQVSAAISTGKYNLVLCKPLASIPITTLYLLSERDLLNQIPSLPMVESGLSTSGAALAWLIVAGGAIVAGATFWGTADFVWN